jgi:membrane protease YdiL (CAAX protease family)
MPSPKAQIAVLVLLTFLPLAVIGLQLALDLDSVWGVFGYSLYKACFLIPPLIYCRVMRIGVVRDILKLQNWRRHLPIAAGLGALAVVIFWVTYYLLSDILLDKPKIVGNIADQFSVTASTIFLFAPITIFFNSLLEEFFYRGFAFGQLVQRQRWLGWLLPSTVFTIQHVLFFYHWVTLVPFAIAVVALFVFALVLQKIYESADSIVAPWLIHVFGDIAMMGVALTLVWGK